MAQSTNTTVAATRTDTVPAGARVRHFDELDERAQQMVVAAANGQLSNTASVPGLRSGDVVVFTDYYRVH
ncbi:hypothetical protein AUR64_16305 [Haloprofundus marisrubri]|uniref:DUF7979 domain-containing protein n=1 Tax=Haloprofundus marisrubri TaxID=1514971 RepID=A0A0W1R7E2_9EURY|nr:hypothetical protein [Haloprofundus marisrubri]KTG09341.1 hypothetical protein AUR64_16305 [Haloprofundus marisrubri]